MIDNIIKLSVKIDESLHIPLTLTETIDKHWLDGLSGGGGGQTLSLPQDR